MDWVLLVEVCVVIAESFRVQRISIHPARAGSKAAASLLTSDGPFGRAGNRDEAQPSARGEPCPLPGARATGRAATSRVPIEIAAAGRNPRIGAVDGQLHRAIWGSLRSTHRVTERFRFETISIASTPVTPVPARPPRDRFEPVDLEELDRR